MAKPLVVIHIHGGALWEVGARGIDPDELDFILVDDDNEDAGDDPAGFIETESLDAWNLSDSDDAGYKALAVLQEQSR